MATTPPAMQSVEASSFPAVAACAKEETLLRLRATPFASLFCSQHLSIFRSSVAGFADCVVVFVFGVLGSSAYLCQLCVDQRLTLGTRAGSSGAGSMTTPSRSAFDTCGSLQSPKELTAALSELGRRQLWHDALSAMQMLAHAGRSRLASIEAFNAAITCCSNGTWKGSLALLSTATAMSLRHSLVTAGAAIKAAGAQSAHGPLAAQPEWHNALHLLSCMRQHSMIPNIRHHNAILSCLLYWSTALCIFKSVLNCELEPTEFTSSLLMKKLETNWPMAIHTFLSMQRLRLEHDAISGNAALRAAGNHRRVSP